MKFVRRILLSAAAVTAIGIAGCGGGGGGGSTEAPASSSPPPSSGAGTWTVRVSWEAAQATGVYGYRLYAGSSASSLTSTSGLLTDTNVDVPISTAGTYYFAVSAVDVNNVESSQSAPISVEVR
mgnify:CR=1 FL=1